MKNLEKSFARLKKKIMHRIYGKYFEKIALQNIHLKQISFIRRKNCVKTAFENFDVAICNYCHNSMGCNGKKNSHFYCEVKSILWGWDKTKPWQCLLLLAYCYLSALLSSFTLTNCSMITCEWVY